MTVVNTNSYPERILITGASGNVGLATVRALLKQPDNQRFEVISGMSYSGQFNQPLAIQPDGYVTFDFTDATTFDAALAGVSRVLLVRPP